MCGIAGFFGEMGGRMVPRRVLHRMVAAISHRGPDESGFHVEGRVGLGHARLSIIDLSSGQQPMCNEDQSVWVTFNGEIFNYVELADELIEHGHKFHTRSDTETIVHCYEEKGPDCVEYFNGDFAFALWDRKQDLLMLARDRMGVRPVYYTMREGTLFFASEMKSLLQGAGIRGELDPVALDQSFTFWFPLAPRTPFKNINELPPGHVLICKGGKVTIRPYWKLTYPSMREGSDLEGKSETQIAEELAALLIDATRIRLRADVPVGAYLSGGLDSSITTALIRQFSSSRLCTFSVRFESKEFDETPHQMEMVKALGTEHQSILCSRRDIGQVFPDVIRHTERPVLRTAPAPLYELARLVRSHGFKVVLTGEGADEILAGYDIFKEAKIRRFWARNPASKWRPLLLRRLYPYLAGIQGQPQPYLEAFFKAGLEHADDPLFSHLPRWSMTARTKAFFSDGLRECIGRYDAIEEMRAGLPEGFAGWHPLSRSQYLEAAYLLPGYILSSQGDRVAMAHAVEGRFPFLDHRVVEYAARIPPRMKLRGLREKHILREAVGKYLPKQIAERTKQPYRSPDSQSFFGPTGPAYAEELLSPEAIDGAGYFDSKAVCKLVEKCRGKAGVGFRDNMALVGILSVQLLHRQFVRG